MKYLLLALLLTCSAAQAEAATPIPPELVGIWATKDSQFHDQALWTGQAIYLDADGNGAIVGGKGDSARAAIIGVRLVVTAYDPSTHVIGIELSDGAQHMNGQLNYDPASKSIVSALDKARYERRADRLFDIIRKALLDTH